MTRTKSKPPSNKKHEPDPVCVQAARAAIVRAGWDAKRDLRVFATRQQLMAQGAQRNRSRGEVVLVIPPNQKNEFADVVTRERLSCLRPPEGSLTEMISSDVYAQVGTFKVCPWGAIDYAEILQAVADGLQSAGASARQVRDYAVEVAGLFISSVVAGVYAVRGPDPAVFRRGVLTGTIIRPASQGNIMTRTASVWCAIQMRLWGDDADICSAARSYSPPQLDIVEFEANRGTAILIDSYDFVERSEDGLVWSDPTLARSLADELQFRYNSWPIKAFQLAELFFPYVVADREGGNPPVPSEINRGRDPVGRPSQDANSRRRGLVSQPVDLGEMLSSGAEEAAASALPDPFALRLAQDGDFRDRILQRIIGDGPGTATAVPSTDVLHALYQRRAKRITIPSTLSQGHESRFPIAHLTRRPLGLLVPTLGEIDWGATRPTRDGRLELYRKHLSIDEPIPVHVTQGRVPDLCYVVDSSGSMKWNWQQGEGPYDCLLRAVYSVQRFIRETNKAALLKYCAVNFSNTTIRTGWRGYDGLAEVRRLLFQHQNGGTRLDCQVLRQVAAESRDRFLCLMVTDGQLKNAAEVAATAADLSARGNWFALVHIGAPSDLVRLIRDANLPAHTISAASELEGLCLEYAQKAWGTEYSGNMRTG